MGWCELNTTTAPEAHLRSIGAYGFDERAPQILAALVTEDPMLLIGASGTGKTFLLNSLSEALGLEHRHYNASLLSFDDLVGFPFPDAERKCVEFLETPATVWGAESVLVDEISRCKPEHQNRLFSLIHERRLQGIALGRLRYRWAAMNPCSADQDASGAYSGSEPLDQALADRFGLFIQVDDWAGLDEKDQLLIADPSGEGTSSPRNEALKRELARWRADFEEGLPRCPRAIVSYASSAATFLNGNGLRVSPRRARFLSRSLFAITIITGGPLEKAFRNTLAASLPQPTWGASVDQALIEAAHRLAWDSSFLAGDEQWIHHFHTERLLLRKLKLLLKAPSPDAATQAIAEFIGSEAPERVAAFCPLINAGTETDNGQTGRKLVMDYYGPRVGQGGGALSGKHLTHVDRLGAYAAREAAVEAVRSGARECKIILAYAPNIHEPLELAYEMEGRGVTRGRSDFSHRVLRQRCSGFIIDDSWATGTHFWDEAAPWNAGQRCPPPPPPDHRG